jgi:hypothetical protein
LFKTSTEKHDEISANDKNDPDDIKSYFDSEKKKAAVAHFSGMKFLFTYFVVNDVVAVVLDVLYNNTRYFAWKPHVFEYLAEQHSVVNYPYRKLAFHPIFAQFKRICIRENAFGPNYVKTEGAGNYHYHALYFSFKTKSTQTTLSFLNEVTESFKKYVSEPKFKEAYMYGIEIKVRGKKLKEHPELNTDMWTKLKFATTIIEHGEYPNQLLMDEQIAEIIKSTTNELHPNIVDHMDVVASCYKQNIIPDSLYVYL